MKETDIKDVLIGHNYDRIQLLQQSKDVQGNLAVVYFTSEVDAAKCFYDIRKHSKRNMNGEKIEVALKFTTEPSVKLSNLSDTVSKESLGKFFTRYDISKIELNSVSKTAIVTFGSPKHVQLAVEGLHQKVFEGNIVNVESYKYADTGNSIDMCFE